MPEGGIAHFTATLLETSHGKKKKKNNLSLQYFIIHVYRALIGLLTPTQRRMPYLRGRRRGQGLASGWVSEQRRVRFSPDDVVFETDSPVTPCTSVRLFTLLYLPHVEAQECTSRLYVTASPCSLSWSGVLIIKLCPRQPLHTYIPFCTLLLFFFFFPLTSINVELC